MLFRTFEPNTRVNRATAAFTLVELLVVVGIVAVLMGLLLPVLSRTRAAADRTACAAALAELGRAFSMYAGANRQTFPVAVEHSAPAGSPAGAARVLTKRWFDFLSPFLGDGINEDGSDEWAWLRLSAGRHPIRGCARWAPEREQDGPGYAMNHFPMNEPGRWGLRLSGSGGPLGLGTMSWAVIGVNPVLDGDWPRVARYTMPSEKALVVENLTDWMEVGAWPWWEPVGAAMPAYPDKSKNTLDFRRHPSQWLGRVRETTPSMNVLYADGHVAFTSVRRAQHAVNFNAE